MHEKTYVDWIEASLEHHKGKSLITNMNFNRNMTSLEEYYILSIQAKEVKSC